MTRVEIPVYHDHWMMGDRFGQVTSYLHKRVNDSAVARVKLDISGKTVEVLIDDCRIVTED